MPDWSARPARPPGRAVRVSLTMHNKYIPSGQYNNSLVGPNEAGLQPSTLPNSANINEVDSAFYTDLSGQYQIKGDDTLVVFAAVNNVFDKDPPTAPSVAGNGNFILFDPIGRSYRAGLAREVLKSDRRVGTESPGCGAPGSFCLCFGRASIAGRLRGRPDKSESAALSCGGASSRPAIEGCPVRSPPVTQCAKLIQEDDQPDTNDPI